MATTILLRAKTLDRQAVRELAAWPTLERGAMRREIESLAGGLPVLLWALALLGLFWADVSWNERFGGLASFHKLLIIPVLLAQFQRSANGMRALVGFFASVLV